MAVHPMVKPSGGSTGAPSLAQLPAARYSSAELLALAASFDDLPNIPVGPLGGPMTLGGRLRRHGTRC